MFTTEQKFIGNKGHTPLKKAKTLNETNEEPIAGQPELFPDHIYDHV